MALKPGELAEMSGADFWRFAEVRLLHIKEEYLMQLRVAALQTASSGTVSVTPDKLFAAWTGRDYETGETMPETVLERLFAPTGTTDDVIGQMMRTTNGNT